jgi:polar amino acid transport system substrate-binding protein/glutamate/aspartate transport system substrate-binding protein
MFGFAHRTRFDAWLVGLALMLGVSAQATADTSPVIERIRNNGELRLAYRPDASPFSYKDGERPTGYSVNLCLEVAAALQKDLNLPSLITTFIPVTSDTRFDALTEGHADLLCEATTVTLKRRETMDFSIPTFVSGASLMIRPGGPQSMGALGGKKIGVLANTTTAEALANSLRDAGLKAEIILVQTHNEGFQRLQDDQIAAYFGDRTILETHLNEVGGDLMLADSYLTIEPYALAMPIDHEFRLAVDRALSRLFRTGGLIKVFRQSFPPQAKPSDLIKALSRTSGLPE